VITDPQVDVSGDGNLAFISLHDGKANAMSTALLDTLTDAIAQAEVMARAIVITGEGKAFSAGLALPELIDLDRRAMARFMDRFAAAMRRVLECARPTVAAINGHAIAGGCVLALMCDHRLMTSAPVKIGLNEVQLGLGLPAVILEPLRARLPPTSLTTIALEGALVDPTEALRLGLVDEIIAPTDLLGVAAARARTLAGGGPLAYAQIKRALLRPMIEQISRHDEAEREAWLDTWFSPEAQRRLRAAVAKLGHRS